MSNISTYHIAQLEQIFHLPADTAQFQQMSQELADTSPPNLFNSYFFFFNRATAHQLLEFKHTVSLKSSQSEPINELKKSILLSHKELLLQITQNDPSDSDITLLTELVKEKSSLTLIDYKEGKSVFSLLISHSTFSSSIEIMESLLLSQEQISSDRFNEIKQFLFNCHPLYESTPFQNLMKKESCNQLFDRIIALIDDEDLNTHSDWKNQVLKFAYSDKRYNGVFLGDDEINEPISPEFKPQNVSVLNESKPDLYNQWVNERGKSSNTLTTCSTDQKSGVENWKKGDDYIRELAKRKENLSLDAISTLNKILTKNEAGVENPGVTRDKSGKLVRISGGWRHLPCPPDKLNEQLAKFDLWMKKQYVLCENRKKDPILFAAQTYQRLVTLHPFENGNGRTARAAMDCILETYEILPPVLGEDVLDALFTLEPTPKNGAQFIKKIVSGIRLSYTFLKIA